MPPRRIYLLSPKELSPETIAVAFAKTSRSPQNFEEIAAELSEESSAKFHEKWVVGYGHASVAEHAVLHIAMENVSRLAVESIESNRLASYTEKSTRYQKWDSDHFFIPPELDDHPLREEYIRTCKLLFKAYVDSLVPTRALVESKNPRRENESEEAFDRRIRSQYVDACRFLLPAASLANLGMTANARVLEHAIIKMLSHPLMEVRQIGEMVKKVSQKEIPTLVKYAEASPYLVETQTMFGQMNVAAIRENGKDWCRLVDYDPQGELKILAALLFRFNNLPFSVAFDRVRASTPEENKALAADFLGKLTDHDIPLRELEYSTYTFEIILDQGGYAELKRHRMMTQTPQALSTLLGYAVPYRIVEAGFEVAYRSAMESAAKTYLRLHEWNPHIAAYTVPNGFNRRVLLTMNLREAIAFCQLRSAANAHFSMRRAAGRVADEIKKVHPLFGRFLKAQTESWQEIESRYFEQF